MRLERAVPVIQVSDVGRSIDWYVARFGFDADPFPKMPAGANVPAARECEETAP